MKKRITRLFISVLATTGLMQTAVADNWYVPESIGPFSSINSQSMNETGSIVGTTGTSIVRPGGSGEVKIPVIKIDNNYHSVPNVFMPWYNVKINNSNQIAINYYDRGLEDISQGIGLYDPADGSFQDIGNIGFLSSGANRLFIGGLNDNGNIAGSARYYKSENLPNPHKAFAWIDNILIDINAVDQNIELGESYAVGINNNDLVVGTYRVNNEDTRVFTFLNNKITDLGIPVECLSTQEGGFTAVRVTALNNNNEVAGDCNTSSIFNSELFSQRAFIINQLNEIEFLQLPESMNSRSIIQELLDDEWLLFRGSEKTDLSDTPSKRYLHNRITGYTKAIHTMLAPNTFVDDFGFKNIVDNKNILLVDNVILKFVENLPPFFNEIQPLSIDENQQLSYLIPADDHDQETGSIITFSSSNLPDGATLDPATGLLEWTPSGSQSDIFNIEITVTDNAMPAESVTETLVVTVNDVVTNEAPTANAGFNPPMHVGEEILLDGSASSDDNTATADLAYSWIFTSVPTGSTATLVDANTVKPTFVSDLPGDYIVELTVTDEGGLSSTASVTASSTNSAPTADAGSAQGSYVGNLVTLDGSSSLDPDGDSISYVWALVSQPAGSISILSSQATENPTLVPDLPGEYTIELVVSDSHVNSTPAQVLVTIITAEQYAEGQLIAALNLIGSLPDSAFTAKGDQKGISKKIQSVLKELAKNNVPKAFDKLAKAIERVDGCALRGTPDVKGMEPKQKEDFIGVCSDQEAVYTLLINAQNALI